MMLMKILSTGTYDCKKFEIFIERLLPAATNITYRCKYMIKNNTAREVNKDQIHLEREFLLN